MNTEHHRNLVLERTLEVYLAETSAQCNILDNFSGFVRAGLVP